MNRVSCGWKVALLSLCLFAASGVALAGPPKPEQGLVVHEWGTFSTFSGANGVFQKFHPNDQDLPKFVYRGPWDLSKAGRGAVLVSLETPVVYFYTDREMTASVRVDFPEGTMSDWYPQTTRPPHRRIDWTNIKVFPKEQQVVLPTEKDRPSRYYAAREVDASPIQVEAKKGALEHEKFLFYRGVGDPQMPLNMKALGNNNFTVHNQGKEAIPAFVFVQIKDGKVRFEKHMHLSQNASMKLTVPKEASTTDQLAECVTRLLIDQGLFEKEARAMVKTWQKDWFHEEGTRVLYFLPRTLTDACLPMQVTPKPAKLVRVLVGRHDVITPEDEQRLDHLLQKQREYDTLSRKLGRYRWAAESAAYQRIDKAREAQEKP